MTAVHVEEPNTIDLARLDDDGGGSAAESAPRLRDLVIPDSPTTMDAATNAARQREGGGAPNQRRPAREGSAWTRLGPTLRRFLIGR
jgi:hypothetical protein